MRMQGQSLRPWLLLLLGPLLSAALGVGASGQTLDSVRVQISDGMLQGSLFRGVASFKAIPFAAPPVGEGRWRPPQPEKPWKGVRPATRFPPACMQDLVRSQLPWTAEFMPQGKDSEDCLYLNVWQPMKRGNKREPLPVYVFIHGGAFVQGSTDVAVYDGAALAAKGIVVVTIQYRLGVFGFLAHPGLAAESPAHASGNYGLLDCLAALRWVHANIGAFGGDPARVTVGGQSAGASAVHDLLVSPLTHDLLRGAIAESGSGIGPLMRAMSDSEADGVTFAVAANATSVAALRALSARQILAATHAVSQLRFAPVVDGWSIPQDPNAALAAGHTLDVPVLSGVVADEGSSVSGYGRTSAARLRAGAKNAYGSEESYFEHLYPFRDDAEASEQSRVAARDRVLASLTSWASLEAAHAHSPVYLYDWTHVLPWPDQPQYAAFHSSELPYVFGNLQVLQRPFTTEDWRMSAAAMDMWVSFIRTGSPNEAGLPVWSAFNAGNPETMRLDTDAHMQSFTSSERLAFWQTVLLAGRKGSHH